MAIAANVPDAARSTSSTTRRPTRSPPAATRKHASVAITTGLLQKLDREELQGVMAHELSHVRNFDIRFSLMVGVLVGSIALLADFFLRFTFWGGGRRSRRDSRPGGGGLQVVVFVVAIVLAILAPIVARLVQLAVSRQREYLADASAVELTRNPSASSGRWRRSRSTRSSLEVANRATQHLYFENPIKKPTARLARACSRPIRRSSTGSTGCASCRGQPPVPDVADVLDPDAQAAPRSRGLRAAVRRASRRRPPRLPPFEARAILRRADGAPAGPGTGPR